MARVVATIFAGFVALWVAAAQAEDAVIAEIRAAAFALDEAFTNQDAERIKALVTENHMAVTPYYGRRFMVDEELLTLDALDYSIVSEEPAEITIIDSGTALSTQIKSYTGTFEGEPITPHVFASAVWVKQDGNWLQLLYQETAIRPD
ncbi:nuclear transport factor 2 family protein [Bauldia sp.]|uniref:nuclear transport factor 2 family protein n=1 Tax=Bauldia sp. TaxID=2575872 RepID=UPI003BAA4B6A